MSTYKTDLKSFNERLDEMKRDEFNERLVKESRKFIDETTINLQRGDTFTLISTYEPSGVKFKLISRGGIMFNIENMIKGRFVYVYFKEYKDVFKFTSFESIVDNVIKIYKVESDDTIKVVLF